MDRIIVCAWCPEERKSEPDAVRMATGVCPTCVDEFAGCRVGGDVSFVMRQSSQDGPQLPQTTVRTAGRSLVFLGRPGPLLQDAVARVAVDPRD